MDTFEDTWPDPLVSALEDQALAKLLHTATQNGPVGPVTQYGHGPDQVFETVGRRDDPVLILVHGGFFRPQIDRTHLRPLAHSLVSLGWQVVLAEYRRIPRQPLTAISDLVGLERHLRATARTPSRIVGHSAGGLLALLRSLSPMFFPLPPVEIAALAAVSDPSRAARELLGKGAIESWIGAPPPDQPDIYSSLNPFHLLQSGRSARGNVYIVHGLLDATVPFTYSRDLESLTRRPPDDDPRRRPTGSWMLSLPEGENHIDIIDPDHPATLLQPWWQPPIQELMDYPAGAVR